MWFPFHYNDVRGWRDVLGLDLKSTTSDEAAKHFDAAVAQFVLAGADPQYSEGGGFEALQKAIAVDPDFMLAKTLMASFEAQGANVFKDTAVVKKIYDLKSEAEKRPKSSMSDWERSHLKATVALAHNDFLGACRVWEDILVEYPKDILALHLLFFSHITMGRPRGLRDHVYSVVDEYRPNDRYYGNVLGKLCFGLQENLQFEAAERQGKKALEHTPKDVWAIHSMAHVYDESGEARKGIDFLTGNEADWKDNVGLGVHVAWHRGLHHLYLGEFEEGRAIFEASVRPKAVASKFPFPLSDAVAFLLRLEMEGFSIEEDKEAWREIAVAYEDQADSINNVFYDWHALAAFIYGDKEPEAARLRKAVMEQAERYEQDKHEKSYNCKAAFEVGVAMIEALDAYAKKDYDDVVAKLMPIRFDLHGWLGGSHAQKDVIDQLLLRSAIRGGKSRLAQQLLRERRARTIEVERTDGEKSDAIQSRRFLRDIQKPV